MQNSPLIPVSESPVTFFVYGTLLDTDILEIVLGRPICHSQMPNAKVAGLQKFTYPGDSFPILLASESSFAEGALLLNLNATDLQRMDFYEGDEYGFEPVKAQLDDGSYLDALYNNAADQSIKSDVLWSLEHWQQTEKPVFIGYVERYMTLYGTMSVDDADIEWRKMVDVQS